MAIWYNLVVLKHFNFNSTHKNLYFRLSLTVSFLIHWCSTSLSQWPYSRCSLHFSLTDLSVPQIQTRSHSRAVGWVVLSVWPTLLLILHDWLLPIILTEPKFILEKLSLLTMLQCHSVFSSSILIICKEADFFFIDFLLLFIAWFLSDSWLFYFHFYVPVPDIFVEWVHWEKSKPGATFLNICVYFNLSSLPFFLF